MNDAVTTPTPDLANAWTALLVALGHDAATAASAAVAPATLAAYFRDVPAHAVAVGTLDHTQFVNDVPLDRPAGTHFPLRAGLERCAKEGPGPYGRAWLALLDVVVLAIGGPTQEIQAARSYITATAMASPTNPMAMMMPGYSAMMTMPGLQEAMQTLLGGDPATMMSSCLSGGGGDPSGFVGSLVERLQTMLAADPDGVPQALQPAVAQILDGFRTLSQALATTPSGA